MLSVERRKHEQLYAYRGGMLNTAWIAGVARKITKRDGYIQQTNNLNQMIHFTLEDGDTMPYWVREGANLKVVARVTTSKVGDEPVVVLKALAFEQPSILDMPPREAWERAVRAGVPTDDVRPEGFRPDEEEPRMHGLRVADTGNMVKVAGFVSGFYVEAPGMVRPDGGDSRGCLVLTLRQTKDKEDLIPVRYYGAKAVSLGSKLKVGVPLRVDGNLRVRLKNTGEPAGEDGILPTNKYLYIHTSIPSVANLMDIKEEPLWSKEMVLETASRRVRPQAAPAARAPVAPVEAPAAANEPTVAKARQNAADADLDIDEKTLQLLNK